MAKETRQLSVYWARLVFELLERQGLDAGQLFMQNGLDVSDLANPGARFKQDSFTRLWQMAARQSGNPAIGLEMGRAPSINAFDAYSATQLSSRCVRESLERAVRYQKVVGSALQITMEETPEMCQISFQSQGDELSPAREGFDAGLALAIASMRLMTNHPVTPLYVTFACPEVADLDPYIQLFSCPLHFNKDRYSLCVGLDVLELPMVFANQSMADHHDSLLDKAITSSTNASLSQRVEQMIKLHLPTGEPSIQHAAQAMHMSPRTMQRHLRGEATSFRSLLDEIRKTLAGDYVERSDLPLKEVTFLLGFSDHANFYRAFKRWYGKTPGFCREKG
jgi:AraC-like DNA-binding protein